MRPLNVSCRRIRTGTCAPAGFLAETSGLGAQLLHLPNTVCCRSQPGLGFVSGLGACKAKDSAFGLSLSMYLYTDRKNKFLISKYESKQKHCEGQLSAAVRWCYPSHTFNSWAARPARRTLSQKSWEDASWETTHRHPSWLLKTTGASVFDTQLQAQLQGIAQPQSNTKGFSSSFPREILYMGNTVINPNL